jgi:MATE family multidrug resistance protein
MFRLFDAPYRAEVRANLKLAAPLMAAQLAGVGMAAVDTVFAGRLGPTALAAVAVGVNLNSAFFIFCMGVLMACSPIVAHAVGSKHSPAQIARFTRRAQAFSLAVALFWAVGLNLAAEPVLTRLHLPADTVHLAIAFCRWLSLSAFGSCLWFALRFSAEGLGETKPIVYAGIIGLAANAFLDWLLLFGHWGLPAMGAPGCGVATALASALMAAVLALLYRVTPRLREVATATPAVTSEGTHDMLRLGLPIGAILVVEAGLFVVSSLLMARFGDTAVAAHQIAFNFASLLFMIPLGLGLATTVRVGHAAGAADPAAARFRGQVGITMGAINAFSNATILALLRQPIAELYTDDAGIAARAARFLLLASVFQFVDGVQVTANGALRGIKDTRFPLAITLVAYWIFGVPVSWGLAFHTAVAADGLWWGMTTGLTVAAAGLVWRFLAESRRRRRFESPK